MKVLTRGTTITLVTLVVSVLATPGFGQGAPDRSNSLALEEIVVTAQKREENLQDVPISVSAFSGDRIRSSGIGKLEILSETVPNFFIGESFLGDAIFVRGVGSAQNNLGAEQAVGQIIDGVFYGRSRFSRLSFLDIERIEVLKGPQGALIGKNTTAGAINITTAAPTDTFQGWISPEYEMLSDEGFTVQGAVSGPLSEGLKARLALRYDDRDGYLHNTQTGKDQESRKDVFIRGKLLWEPNDDLDLTFAYQYGDMDHKGENNQYSLCDLTTPQLPTPGGLINLTSVLIAGTTEDCKANFKRAGVAPRHGVGDFSGKDTSFDTASLVVNWRLGEHTLTSITGWAQYDYTDIQDADRSAQESLSVEFAEDYEQWSEELRLVSPQGGKIDYITGLYFLDKKQHTDYLIDVVSFNARRNTLTDEDGKTFALFGQLTWNINEQWAATVGLRYTHEKKDARSQGFPSLLYDTNTPVTVPPFAPAGLPRIHDVSDDLSENNVSPTFNLQWRPNEDAMYYASVRRGYKAGAFNHALVATQDNALKNFKVSDEEVISYELGAKLTLLNGSAQLNAAIFYSEFSDLQQAILIGNDVVNDVVNAADSTSQGAELELRWRPVEHLTLFAALALLNSEFDKFPNATCYALQSPTECVNGQQDLKGRPFTFAPDWTWTVNGEYVWNLGNDFRVTAFLQAYYSDDYYLTQDLDPKLIQEDYVKWDARLTVADARDRWELSLIGRNLGDKVTSNHGDDVPIQTGSVWRAVDPSRSLTIQGTWRF